MTVHGRAAAHAASRGCVSGAHRPTVFPNEARPVQEAGGTPTAAPGGHVKKTQNYISDSGRDLPEARDICPMQITVPDALSSRAAPLMSIPRFSFSRAHFARSPLLFRSITDPLLSINFLIP